jgi:4-hydroxybenzoate polyprenyltransferase
VFVLPGIFLEALTLGESLFHFRDIVTIFYGLLIICITASSNYVINEIVDSKYDTLHPLKKNRPIPSGRVDRVYAYALWILLLVTAILLSWTINFLFMVVTIIFIIQGIVYNIPPIRTKDIPYLDVLSESVNNPIRFLLGWFVVNTITLPALSLILAYWMVGAFFMASKRYSEYITMNDHKRATAYRKSFRNYSAKKLLATMTYYVSLFSFFMGIFLIRYRIELILSIPFIALVISYYLKMSLELDSPVASPENLYKHKKLVGIISISIVVTVILFLIDIPQLRELFSPTAPYYP